MNRIFNNNNNNSILLVGPLAPKYRSLRGLMAHVKPAGQQVAGQDILRGTTFLLDICQSKRQQLKKA